jgi:chromosome transmission fidelity protein 18
MQARHAGGEHAGSQDGPTPTKAAAAAGRTPFAPTGQQQAAHGNKGSGPASNSGKAPVKPPSKPAPLPKAPKGCWLDAARGQAAAKRKAQILAVGANKRAALGQGPKATAAAGEGSGDAEGAGDGAGCGHNGYTVLYKFNEGYTNAVKRPIKMAELLGLHQ